MITMKKFFLKSFIILSLMFLAVLYGMQLANEGIHQMKGYEDERFADVLTVTHTEDGEQELSVFGTAVGSHDLEAKKKKLEEMKAFNFFAELGKKTAGIIKSASEKLIQKISDLF